jgi:hypothetical protein
MMMIIIIIMGETTTFCFKNLTEYTNTACGQTTEFLLLLYLVNIAIKGFRRLICVWELD